MPDHCTLVVRQTQVQHENFHPLLHTGLGRHALSYSVWFSSCSAIWLVFQAHYEVLFFVRSLVPRLSKDMGQKREPGDYCVAHAPNVYANFLGMSYVFTHCDDL